MLPASKLGLRTTVCIPLPSSFVQPLSTVARMEAKLLSLVVAIAMASLFLILNMRCLSPSPPMETIANSRAFDASQKLRAAEIAVVLKPGAGDRGDQEESDAVDLLINPLTSSIHQRLREKLMSEIGSNPKVSWIQRLENRKDDQSGSVDPLLQGVLSVVVEELHREISADKVIPDSKENVNELRSALPFQEHGLRTLYTLVVFSSYRTSLSEFSVIGLSPFAFRTNDGNVGSKCAWIPDGSSASSPQFSSVNENNSEQSEAVNYKGTVSISYVEDNHDRAYDTVVIRCSFPETVGTDGKGGFLYLNVSSGFNVFEYVTVLHERPGDLSSIHIEATSFKHEYAYCSAPIWNQLDAVYLKQWLMYHHHLIWGGKVHYFIYDAIGVKGDVAAVLKPLIDAGFVTLIPMRREAHYETWYHAQHLVLNDCLYRARFLSKWVFFWDFDEYLYLAPNSTLAGLLEERKDCPWISFGNVFFSRLYCLPDRKIGEWAVEKMVFRLEHAVCGGNLANRTFVCHGEEGRRKWMANPRKVHLGSIHRSLDPLWDGGEVLNTSIARINHYRGLVSPAGRIANCQQTKFPWDYSPNSALDGWWWADKGFQDIIGQFRHIPESSQIFQTTA